MLPNFLIIGAQKAATTWLAENIAEHPDVFIAPAKEIYYFNHRFHQGTDWYERHFAEWDGESAIGEATPGYLPHSNAPSRIAETLDQPRLIALLRQPIDRAFSAYWHHVRSSRIDPSTSFVACLETGDDDFELLERGAYVSQLERYFSQFGRDRMLIMLYDQLFTDSASTCTTVFDFLHVDPTFVPSALGEAKNVGGRGVGVLGGPAQRVRELVTPVIDRLPPRLRNPALSIGRRAFERIAFDLGPKKAHFEPLAPETRRRLTTKYFSEEIDRLERLLDVDLGNWKA